MSKIQFLKAIHNPNDVSWQDATTVYDVKDTIFESNSQRLIRMKLFRKTVYDVKDTIFESNSYETTIFARKHEFL